jgi:hypothetical protein
MEIRIGPMASANQSSSKFFSLHNRQSSADTVREICEGGNDMRANADAWARL